MKVAIVGTEPASQGFAPWGDPSWKIWSCSPPGMEFPRVDTFYEVHNPDLFTKEELLYLQFLQGVEDLWLARPSPLLPQGKLLPKAALLERFGPWFFTSSVAWMTAHAILQMEALPEEEHTIAYFGIDMTADGEYEAQRPSLHFFVREAKLLGIKVGAPLESDLLIPPPLYGYCTFDQFYRKQKARKRLAENRLAQTRAQIGELKKLEEGLLGALEAVDYDLRTHGGTHNDPQ